MPNINKILSKVNQAKSAVKSLKGIQAKLSGTGYDLNNLDYGALTSSKADKLAQQAEAAQATLDKRRSSLEKSKASKQTKAYAKSSPETETKDLQYPIGDGLENFLIFRTLPRQQREGENNKNLLAKTNLEIALYVPNEMDEGDITASYKAEGVGMGMRSVLEMKDAGFSKGDGGTLEVMGTALSGAIQTGMDKLGSMMTGGASNFLAGRATNPMEEQMFEGVGFRDFSFSYEFYPRNTREAAEVKSIIWGFKTAMLPDTYGNAEGGTAIENYFNYPNIFTLEWEGPIAEKFDDFLPMVCKSCKVSHSTKLFEDGYPVSTSMSLDFTEIKILTQENYQQINKSGKAAAMEEKYGSIGGGNKSLAMRRSDTIVADRKKAQDGGG